MKTPSEWVQASTHILLWIALAAMAYCNAENSGFASCWPMILLPPVNVIILVVAFSGLIFFVRSMFVPALRQAWFFVPAMHATIVCVGLIACVVATSAATGPVQCL